MKQKNFETLVFEQTKHRNGRPAWKVFRDGVLLGHVSYLSGEYEFITNDRAMLTLSELFEIVEFIDNIRP